MISICAKQLEGMWYFLAYVGERIVATALSSTRESAAKGVERAIPPNVEHQVVEKCSDFAEKTILMMKELESGNEESKRFTLASEFLAQPIAKVLQAAAAIPIGYVASYGSIAQTADVEARTVGQIMARNPLYPIVACHRVVGADFSLVGYGGSRSPKALQAKLARLSKEAKGYTAKREIPVNGKHLTVFPVELVIKKVWNSDSGSFRQQRLLLDSKQTQ